MPSTNVISASHAEALGRDDGRHAIQEAYLLVSDTPADGSALVVDGSQYLPSWRVLPYGEEVFQASYNNPDLIEAYEYGLDQMVDGSPYSLAWEEGCLFYFGPDYEEEA